jgi:hypothetical protein
MKIAIFEVSSPNHSVMIYNWVEICKENGWGFKVYTTSEIYDQISQHLSLRREEIHIIKNINFFEILKVTWEMKSFDFLMVTSLQNNFLYYLIILFSKTKIVLTIHNLNTWFVYRNISSIKGAVKHIVRVFWKIRVHGYIVNSQNMVDYISHHHLTKKYYEYIPFSLRYIPVSALDQKDKEHSLTITYPGMVSKNRKKYDYFLRLAFDFPNIKFILLGKLNLKEGGSDIKREILNLSLKNVTYYEVFVDESEFDTILRGTDVLFSFVNVNYDNQGVQEVYGKTKDSGVSYLMSEYGLPLLVNNDFKNLSYLDAATLYYSCYEELRKKLVVIMSQRCVYTSLRRKIFKERREQNISTVAARVSVFLKKI